MCLCSLETSSVSLEFCASSVPVSGSLVDNLTSKSL